jgi:P-type conjugative transfer protein TrbJ
MSLRRPCRHSNSAAHPARIGDRRHDRLPLPARPRAARRLAALAATLVLLACLLAPAPAAAQTPVTDALHIALNAYWHYIHYLQFGLQIYQQTTQITNQIRQIDNQLRALQKLDHPNWRDLQLLLSDLDALVRSGTSIGYALDNAGGQLRQVFPGWTPWPNPTAAQTQSERSLDTFRAGLSSISRQSQSLAPGEQTLAAIRQQMTATDGPQMALEQLTTPAAFSAQEQLLTRQSLAVSANFQAVAGAYWIDREAQGRAAFQALAFETGLAANQSTSPGLTFAPPGLP